MNDNNENKCGNLKCIGWQLLKKNICIYNNEKIVTKQDILNGMLNICMGLYCPQMV